MGAISKTLMLVAGNAVILAILCNLPVNPFVPGAKPANLTYLADTWLTSLDAEKPLRFKANELWEKTGAVIMAVRRPGCSLCREEALELAGIKFELKLRNIPLYAVVHETLGVEEFAPFLDADGIYLDKERKFYGPQERWMLLSGFMRASVWSNILRNRQKGVEGNLDGEGRLLGGVFVVGPGQQGILLEHREQEFGHLVNVTNVVAAVRKMAKSTPTTS